jgi:hypothetical protein
METDESLLKKRGRGRPPGSKNKPKNKKTKTSKKLLQSYTQEEDIEQKFLDDNKLTEIGYNVDTERIINANPIDQGFYYRGMENVPIAGAQYAFTEAMVDELRRCKNDIVYFAENFFYITNLDRGKEKIKLYGAQRRVLTSLANNRFLALLAARQTGKSTLLTIYVLWMVCFNSDFRAAIVANKESTAIKIFRRIRMAYEQLPNYIKPGVKDYAKTGMTLGNDSSVDVSTTSTTAIRGDSLNSLCIDEAAFIEPHILEEFWASVIPAISSGKTSKIFMVSTPNGVGNKFYEIYSAAENNPKSKWKAERIDWWDVPERDEAWKADMVAALGSEEKFLQEFGNVFIDDASCAVGALVIERFKLEKKNPVWTSENGEYTVFEFPNSNNLYVIGVDVGEGIGRAATVAQILDVTDLKEIKQVGVFSSAVIEPFHFANKLNVIGHSWGLPPILIERNNCGAQVIDALYHNHSYEKLVSYNKISEKDQYNRTRNLGVLSHTNIKFDGIQNMRYWTNHLQVVKVNDTQTISEFETFVRHPNGVYRKRSDNYFDDRVMALVWALFILEPSLCQQYFNIEEYDNQLKPLKIVSNDYWDKDLSSYQLKDLTKNSNLIPHLYNIEDSIEPASPSLGTTSDIFRELDKYELDVDSLIEQGYQFLNLDSQ